MSLEAMLRALRDETDNLKQAPSILPEAAIARLRDFAARYNGPVPFKVGDLVTPREEAPVRNSGEPHLVLSVYEDAMPMWGGAETGQWQFGDRLTIQVASITDGGRVVLRHWVNHADFEPYTGPGS